MNKKITGELIGGLFIFLLVAVYVYEIYKVQPTQAEIAASAQPVQTIDVNSITTTTTQFKARDMNGVLPISVPDTQPQDNPFKSTE